MASVGMIDASLMTNLDPIFVLIMGMLVSSILYPYLSKRGISFPTTYKYSLGSTFGMLAMISSILIDHGIKRAYRNNEGSDQQISILWQAISYACVGAGEIFTLATSLDVAFCIAPKTSKGECFWGLGSGTSTKLKIFLMTNNIPHDQTHFLSIVGTSFVRCIYGTDSQDWHRQ